MENWGKSVDGYTGGGNFDDNPKLENFTLKSGVTINLELSYLTIGELNEKKDN